MAGDEPTAAAEATLYVPLGNDAIADGGKRFSSASPGDAAAFPRWRKIKLKRAEGAKWRRSGPIRAAAACQSQPQATTSDFSPF